MKLFDDEVRSKNVCDFKLIMNFSRLELKI